MKKIVFFSIPAHGHTNPTLGVVRELIARGHQVWYYSYNIMREKIEAAGATFVSCDDYDAELQLTPQETVRIGKDLALSTRVLVDTTLALDKKLCGEMEHLKPDCIVADSMAVWGKAAARKLGIPFVCSTTTLAFNQHSAKIMKQGIVGLCKLLLSLPRIQRDIRRLQQNGYPVKTVLDLIGSDDSCHTVVYTSPEFQPCSDTFSDKYAFVGPSIRPASTDIEKTGEKLIYVSMGTVNNEFPHLYRQLISMLKDTGYQVIMSVGNLTDIEALPQPPENISIVSQIDQIAVLSKADLFLSHCGMNSVSESLYFGVPLIMLPQTTEQRGVAERVRQLGAGIYADPGDPASIQAAIGQIFADETYHSAALRVAESFRQCSGAKGAADKIEQVCGIHSQQL